MTRTEDTESGPYRQDRGDSNRRPFLRPRGKIILTVISLLGFAGAMLVMWHTEHVLMAVPFLILALFPLLAVITMRVLGPPDKAERGVHIGSDPNKRAHRKSHHGKA